MITIKDYTFDENSKIDVLNFLCLFPRYCNRRLFYLHFENLLEEMKQIKFPEEFKEFSFPQKLYHFLINDFDLLHGHCIICGERCGFKNIKSGYAKYCSGTCALKDPTNIQKRVQTKFVKNGGYYRSQDENEKIRKTYENKTYEERNKTIEKRQLTMLEKYGAKNAFQVQSIKNKSISKINALYGGVGNASSELKDKQKNTMILKYGVDHNWKSNDTLLNGKKTRKEKYGVENYVESIQFKSYISKHKAEIHEKELETKRKNNSFNSSKIEEKLTNYFITNNKNFLRQYTDDRYPFYCDFYFPEKDLFLEINGTWTHGRKPFEGTEEDLKQLDLWKSKNSEYYKNAIETWTVRDVKKRNTAKKNNLNFIEIFSIDFDEILNIITKLI